MYLTPPIVICPLAFMGLSAVVYPPCCPAPQMPPSSATMGGLGVPINIIKLLRTAKCAVLYFKVCADATECHY